MPLTAEGTRCRGTSKSTRVSTREGPAAAGRKGNPLSHTQGHPQHATQWDLSVRHGRDPQPLDAKGIHRATLEIPPCDAKGTRRRLRAPSTTSTPLRTISPNGDKPPTRSEGPPPPLQKNEIKMDRIPLEGDSVHAL